MCILPEAEKGFYEEFFQGVKFKLDLSAGSIEVCWIIWTSVETVHWLFVKAKNQGKE